MDTTTATQAAQALPVEYLADRPLRVMAPEERDAAQGIGGGDIAAIMGLSPWRTAYDVWLQKTGKVARSAGELQPWQKWGLHLERPIAAFYADSHEEPLAKGSTLAREDRPFQLGTPDYFLLAEKKGLEVKNVAGFKSCEWGEVGSDDIPQGYLVQCHWYMSLTSLPAWDVAALIGGSDYRDYAILFDADIESALLEEAEHFYTKHVLADIPPAPQSSETAAAYLKNRFPRNVEPIREATAEEALWAINFRDAYQTETECAKRKDDAKTALQSAIGFAEGIQGEFGKITWKRTKDSTETNWEALARELGATAEQIKKHTSTREGFRRFLANFK